MNAVDLLKQLECFKKYFFLSGYPTTIETTENGIKFDSKMAQIFTIPKDMQSEKLHEVLFIRYNVSMAAYIDIYRNLNYGGFTDWRIPNADEIHSIKFNFDSFGIDRYWNTAFSDCYWYKEYEDYKHIKLKSMYINKNREEKNDNSQWQYNKIMLVR